MNNKLIVVDCDGVLLNWVYAFDVWMAKQGMVLLDRFSYDIEFRYANCSKAEGQAFIKSFNESACMGFLPPHRDAIYYIKLLHEKHGFVFHVISTFSDCYEAGKLRTMNLRKLFGQTAFCQVEYHKMGSSKKASLEKYKDTGTFFVEDLPRYVQEAEELGLQPIMMEHSYNMDYDRTCPVVSTWKEIYEMVT